MWSYYEEITNGETVFKVVFYGPNGELFAERKFADQESAAARVSYLNGGNKPEKTEGNSRGNKLFEEGVSFVAENGTRYMMILGILYEERGTGNWEYSCALFNDLQARELKAEENQ